MFHIRNLPGHLSSIHFSDCVEFPGQSNPPNAGSGSLQVRSRLRSPEPQVVEHGDQLSQVAHLPFTIQYNT